MKLTTPSSSTALCQTHSSSSSSKSPLNASLQIGHGLAATSGSDGWMIVFFMSSARTAAESVALVLIELGPAAALADEEPVTAVEEEGSEPLATGTRSTEVD